ncbi:hypothetical protein GCM10009593_38620 [Microlunatus antarcticus]
MGCSARRSRCDYVQENASTDQTEEAGDALALKNDYALHLDPVWRERANYILNAELAGEDFPKHFEQLWTRRVGDNAFEICCIPLLPLRLGPGRHRQ